VEDNAHFRKSVTSLVNQANGMVCEHAFSSCEQAMTMLETGSLPDILLLDIGLSGMSGIEGISKFKSITPSTQIIMLTMHDDEKKVFEAISAGAIGYLLKSSPLNILSAVFKKS
jgi:DNA-binding NarL/FixJ family response regulator